MKEQKDAAKEAFDRASLASFLGCLQVAGKQERFCCRVPVPGDDGDRMQGGVDPGDKTQTPIRSIQRIMRGSTARGARPQPGALPDLPRPAAGCIYQHAPGPLCAGIAHGLRNEPHCSAGSLYLFAQRSS